MIDSNAGNSTSIASLVDEAHLNLGTTSPPSTTSSSMSNAMAKAEEAKKKATTAALDSLTSSTTSPLLTSTTAPPPPPLAPPLNSPTTTTSPPPPTNVALPGAGTVTINSRLSSINASTATSGAPPKHVELMEINGHFYFVSHEFPGTTADGASFELLNRIQNPRALETALNAANVGSKKGEPFTIKANANSTSLTLETAGGTRPLTASHAGVTDIARIVRDVDPNTMIAKADHPFFKAVKASQAAAAKANSATNNSATKPNTGATGLSEKFATGDMTAEEWGQAFDELKLANPDLPVVWPTTPATSSGGSATPVHRPFSFKELETLDLSKRTDLDLTKPVFIPVETDTPGQFVYMVYQQGGKITANKVYYYDPRSQAMFTPGILTPGNALVRRMFSNLNTTANLATLNAIANPPAHSSVTYTAQETAFAKFLRGNNILQLNEYNGTPPHQTKKGDSGPLGFRWYEKIADKTLKLSGNSAFEDQTTFKLASYRSEKAQKLTGAPPPTSKTTTTSATATDAGTELRNTTGDLNSENLVAAAKAKIIGSGGAAKMAIDFLPYTSKSGAVECCWEINDPSKNLGSARLPASFATTGKPVFIPIRDAARGHFVYLYVVPANTSSKAPAKAYYFDPKLITAPFNKADFVGSTDEIQKATLTGLKTAVGRDPITPQLAEFLDANNITHVAVNPNNFQPNDGIQCGAWGLAWYDYLVRNHSGTNPIFPPAGGEAPVAGSTTPITANPAIFAGLNPPPSTPVRDIIDYRTYYADIYFPASTSSSSTGSGTSAPTTPPTVVTTGSTSSPTNKAVALAHKIGGWYMDPNRSYKPWKWKWSLS